MSNCFCGKSQLKTPDWYEANNDMVEQNQREPGISKLYMICIELIYRETSNSKIKLQV